MLHQFDCETKTNICFDFATAWAVGRTYKVRTCVTTKHIKDSSEW